MTGYQIIFPKFEEVSGIIVGDVLAYSFYQGDKRIAATCAYSEADAVQWFRDNYPAEFATGAEMRIYA